jgi:alpha-tubulin suppressor-like RCC1 family protein
MAITTDNKLYGWGKNADGEIGDNSRTDRNAPVQIGSLTNWKTPGRADKHAACVKTDGTLWMWGRNFNGELMVDDRVYRSSPVQVGSDTDWELPATGSRMQYFQHVIKTDGTLWAAGGNTSGVLGLNIAQAISRSSPVQVGSETTWRNVAGGQKHALASEES